MIADLRQALRSLPKAPGFVSFAALTLALGMRTNTTFFSVLYGVGLKRLPFPDTHELVEIKNVGDALGRNVGRVSSAPAIASSSTRVWLAYSSRAKMPSAGESASPGMVLRHGRKSSGSSETRAP